MRRVLCLILIISSVAVHGQTIDQTLSFANTLFEKKEYSNAVEVYKRVLFFDQNGEYGREIYKNIADCLYNTEKFEDAANYYELAFFSESSDSVKNEINFLKASCYLILRQYDYAQIELLNLTDSLYSGQSRKRDYYEGMVYFAKDEFAASEKSFKSQVSDTTIIHKLFRKNDRISRISPKKAKILSMIIPGLGQFYVGDIKNGLNSMILTGGLFYLGIRAGLNNSFWEAGISTLPWFQRYYTGGFTKAEKIAQTKIKERRYKVYNQLLDELEKQPGSH